jgi:Rrf2 family protein
MARSTRFSAALHVLACLDYSASQIGNETMSSADLATSVGTSPVVIRTLIRDLIKANLIETKEGKGGGVRLARSSPLITLEEVYVAVERGPVIPQNDHKEHKPCAVSCGIKQALNPIFQEVDAAVCASLRRQTLEKIGRSILRM